MEHGPINMWCELGKDQLKTGGQKWNCRVLKISWHVGLGLKNVWSEFEKRSVKKSGVYSVCKKTLAKLKYIITQNGQNIV